MLFIDYHISQHLAESCIPHLFPIFFSKSLRVAIEDAAPLEATHQLGQRLRFVAHRAAIHLGLVAHITWSWAGLP